MGARYLVVEGLIGVGKTTMCRLLERERGAKLVLEPAATNPFLEPFYTDPQRYAFPVQMFYLINRWRQQAEISQGDLFSRLVVSDYLFAKDRLFAEKTLPADELALYDRFAGALGAQIPKPELLVYLEAPLSVVMSRIAQRRAPGEEAITEAYLVDLRERYERLLDAYDDSPVLRLDNAVQRTPDELVALLEQALDGELPAAPSAPDRQQALFT
ncbi:MAG: deoxynucleoside kinase [Myxococcota bacterium]